MLINTEVAEIVIYTCVVSKISFYDSSSRFIKRLKTLINTEVSAYPCSSVFIFKRVEKRVNRGKNRVKK